MCGYLCLGWSSVFFRSLGRGLLTGRGLERSWRQHVLRGGSRGGQGGESWGGWGRRSRNSRSSGQATGAAPLPDSNLASKDIVIGTIIRLGGGEPRRLQAREPPNGCLVHGFNLVVGIIRARRRNICTDKAHPLPQNENNVIPKRSGAWNVCVSVCALAATNDPPPIKRPSHIENITCFGRRQTGNNIWALWRHNSKSFSLYWDVVVSILKRFFHKIWDMVLQGLR